ncbi:MAG TPA: hypothetical protein VF603_02150 [Allosphingosinicella sp.]|jgi:hypothetical protein
MKPKLLLAGVLASLLALPAAAQERTEGEDAAAARREGRSERFYVALWWVQPSHEALGRKTVREGDYVLRTRLLPSSLIRLTGDAVAAEGGRVILPAGSQLFSLSTAGPPIWCALERRSSGGRVTGAVLGGLVGRRAPSQLCLIDLDRDGRLDAHFSANSPVRGVPNFSGNRPRNPAGLAPTAFEQLDPERMETEYFVGIRYGGVATLRSNPYFTISFGDGERQGHLTSSVSPQDGVVTALGASFEIVSRNGETLEIDVRRNIPRQPFHVMRTVTYR